MSIPNTLCAAAEDFASDGVLRLAQVLQIVFSIAILGLIGIVLVSRRYRRISVHSNLKIIFGNILLCYALLCIALLVSLIRYQILYLTYMDPCELLISSWMSLTIRYFCYVYTTGFPIWHVAITMERAWATFRPQNYECRSSAYGIACSVLVWVISCTHTAVVAWLALEDEEYRIPHVYIRMTTKTNGGLLLTTQYFLLALDVTTFVADYALLRINRMRLMTVNRDYNLSKSYQINENIVVTMKLVLPMDMCNAVLYIVYTTLATVIRRLSPSIDGPRLNGFYELVSSLTLLQAILSLCVLIRFARNSRRKITVLNLSEEADVYFQLFQKQIDAAP